MTVTNNSPITIIETATIIITATDPVDNLMYAFDCDNDGLFEVGPQVDNTALCSFTAAGDHIVNVQVTDGDGGLVTGDTTVTVMSADTGFTLYLPLIIKP
ncbi:MAG: hypothetical protein H6658_09575 [Ardenticatenaceae bacterium]|nr:hypothetical protein [Ardenticatenaceae bacterium]